jgi:hypothetical protein
MHHRLWGAGEFLFLFLSLSIGMNGGCFSSMSLM